MTTAGDIGKETGYAVLSMVCPRFWASTGGILRNVIAAVGKKARRSSFCDAVRRWGGPRPLWKKAFVDSLACSSMLMSSEM